MGDSLVAMRTENVNTIRSILSNPTLDKEIAEDGLSAKSIDIDPYRNCFILICSEHAIIGLYIIHPLNSAMVEIHANILPEYRKEFADESLHVALDWIQETLPEQYVKIVAQIPDVFPNVYHFALKHGFVEEGKLTKAYRKNDKLCDLHILGLMRDQIAS